MPESYRDCVRTQASKCEAQGTGQAGYFAGALRITVCKGAESRLADNTAVSSINAALMPAASRKPPAKALRAAWSTASPPSPPSCAAAACAPPSVARATTAKSAGTPGSGASSMALR